MEERKEGQLLSDAQIEKLSRELARAIASTLRSSTALVGLRPRGGYVCTGDEFECLNEYHCHEPHDCHNKFGCPGSFICTHVFGG
jgi:hypothetical protein